MKDIGGFPPDIRKNIEDTISYFDGQILTVHYNVRRTGGKRMDTDGNAQTDKLIANTVSSTGVTPMVPSPSDGPIKAEQETETDLYTLLDSLDDEIIRAQMAESGKDIPWVYKITNGGRTTFELTKEGIDQCLRLMTEGQEGRVFFREEVQMVSNTDREALFVGYVERWAITPSGQSTLLDKKMGSKRQGKIVKSRRSGKMESDQFWFEAGSQKAVRNANKRFLTPELRAQIIESAKTSSKVTDVVVEQVARTSGTDVQRTVVPGGVVRNETVGDKVNTSGAYTLSVKQIGFVQTLAQRKGIPKGDLDRAMQKGYGATVTETSIVFPSRKTLDGFIQILQDSSATKETWYAVVDGLAGKGW